MTPTTGSRRRALVVSTEADRDRTIPEWMEMFSDIYGKVDSERSPVQMWVAATAHFTKVGEAIRRMHFANLMLAAAHAFSWMCSFVLRCQRDKGTVFAISDSFSAIVAGKYPLVCGYCEQTYCHCNPHEMDKTANKAAKYKSLLAKRARLETAPDSYTVSRWMAIFNEMYGHHVHMLTLESIGFHFLEEVGEELTALRGLMQLKDAREHVKAVDDAFLEELSTFEGVVDLYENYVDRTLEPTRRAGDAVRARLVHAKVDMFVEFADTFSWLCSILNKVGSIAKNCEDANCRFTQEAFRERLLQEYLPGGDLRCPTCKKCPCKCVFYG